MNFRGEKDPMPLTAVASSAGAEPTELAPVAVATAPNAAATERKVNLRPLASLLPYVKRYRWRAAAALGALILAALTTLIVPSRCGA